MAKHRSVNGNQPRHENLLPNASRIGNFVMSSVIEGTNPGTTRELPPSFRGAGRQVFAHNRHDIEAAGGSVDDIIKVTVQDPAKQRVLLNPQIGLANLTEKWVGSSFT